MRKAKGLQVALSDLKPSFSLSSLPWGANLHLMSIGPLSWVFTLKISWDPIILAVLGRFLSELTAIGSEIFENAIFSFL